MKKTQTERIDTTPITKVLRMPVWFLGAVLLVIAIGISASGMLESVGGDAGTKAFRVLIGLYVGSLVMRVVFQKLSGKILNIPQVSWSGTLFVVGINALVLIGAAAIVQSFHLYGVGAVSVLLATAAIFAFIAAMKVYRISFLEAMTLYALSLAFFAVGFLLVTYVFHASLPSILPAAGVK